MTNEDKPDKASELRKELADAIQHADEKIKAFGWAKTTVIAVAAFCIGFFGAGPLADWLMMPEKTKQAYERIGSLESRVEVLESEKSALETNYNKKIEEITQSYSSAAKEQQAKTDKLVSDYNKLTEDFKNSQASNEKLVARVELLGKEYEALQERYSQLDAALKDAQAETGKSKQDYKSIKNEKESFENQLAAANKIYAELEKEKQELTAKHDGLKQELREYGQTNSELKNKLIDADITISSLNKSIETIERQRKELEEKKAELELRTKSLEEKLHEKDESIKGSETIPKEKTTIDSGKDETKAGSEENKSVEQMIKEIEELMTKHNLRWGNSKKRSYAKSDWFTDALLLSSEPDLPLHGFNFFCGLKKAENYPGLNGTIQLSFSLGDKISEEDRIGSLIFFAKRQENLYRRKNDADMRVIEEQFNIGGGYAKVCNEKKTRCFYFGLSPLVFKRRIYNDPAGNFVVNHLSTYVTPQGSIGFQEKNLGLKVHATIEGGDAEIVTRVPDKSTTPYKDGYFQLIYAFSLMQDITTHMHLGARYKHIKETFSQDRIGGAEDWTAKIDNKYTTIQFALTDLTEQEFPLAMLRNIVLELTHKNINDELFMLTKPRFEYKLKLIGTGEENSKRNYYGLELGWDDPKKGGIGLNAGIFWAFDW